MHCDFTFIETDLPKVDEIVLLPKLKYRLRVDSFVDTIQVDSTKLRTMDLSNMIVSSNGR